MGTVIWVVEYKRGTQIEFKTFMRSGTDYESIQRGLMESIKRNGWKILNIEVTANTFLNGG